MTSLTRHVAHYQWTRLRRSWLLPAAGLGGLAVGLLTATQTVAVTGAGVLQQAVYFLPLLHLGVMVLTSLAIYPEADEDSAELLWSWPADNVAVVLGKFTGVAPLAGLAALGAFLPPAALMARFWWGSGLSVGYLAAELGLLALWLGTGALFAGGVGGALGLWTRGLRLYALLLVVWLAGVLGPVLLHNVVPVETMVWNLLEWSFASVLRPDYDVWDLYGLLPLLMPILAHRLAYGTWALLVVVCVALGFRRGRRLGAPAARPIWTATALLGLMTLLACAAAWAPLERAAAAVREEVSFYLREAGREGAGSWEAGPAGSAVAPAPGRGLVITAYDLQLDASRPPRLRVDAGLELRNEGDATVSRPSLLLRHDFRVKSVQVAGEPAPFTRDGDRVYLDELMLAPGTRTTVRLEYEGDVEHWRFRGAWWRGTGSTLDLPALDLATFVRPGGLYLPASYGWYPLVFDGPLARVEGNEVAGYALLEDFFNEPAAPRSVPTAGEGPASDQGPGGGSGASVTGRVPEFRVTVRRSGAYPLLSNLQEISDPGAPVVTMRGRSDSLVLVGWPLASARADGGTVYYPADARRQPEAALRTLAKLREAYRLFGVEAPAGRVVVPPLPWIRTWVDPWTGFVLDPRVTGGVSGADVIQSILTGRRPPSETETCLAHGVALYLDRRSGTGSPPGPFDEMPCDPSPPGQVTVTAGDVARWLERAGEGQIRAALSTLYRIARERPLTAGDLREALEP